MTVLRKLSLATLGLGMAFTAYAAGGQKHATPPEGGWAFDKAFGEFDEGSLQRGFQVYQEVCATCHSMKLLSYRNLGEKGGPFYDPAFQANENAVVKGIAAMNEIQKGVDDIGDPVFGPATPADAFKSPHANEAAARAANAGALPPDLSVITKARHGGASYVYSLLTGYAEGGLAYAPELEFPLKDDSHGDDHSDAKGGHGDEHELHGVLSQPVGQYYNPYMQGDTTTQWAGDPRHVPPGGFLAMAPPLSDGRIEYRDGTEATTAQMAADVATFLAWAAEPKQVNRKSAGFKVIGFLIVFAILLWFSFHQIWRDVKH